MHALSPRVAGRALALAAAIGLAPLAHADIIAIESSGTVLVIDPVTGVGSILAAAGPSGANALARDPGGAFVTAAGGRLHTIDPLTGNATAGAMLDLAGAAIEITGLAWVGADLYAINRTGAGTPAAADTLWKIDPVTGLGLSAWNATSAGLQGLAANDGTLYGWDVTLGLVRLGLGGAGALVVDDVAAATGTQGASIQTLAFDATGALYGAESSLYRIDPLSGAVAFVGTGGYGNVRGMEFRAGAVPTPGSLLLVGLGIAAIVIAGRRRRTPEARGAA
jgi:hypothetical protein